MLQIVGNLSLTIGGFFFGLVLLIVYNYKTNETSINNRVFKLLLVLNLFTVLSEIGAIIFIFLNNSNGNFSVVSEVFSRLNLLFTLSWVFVVVTYLLITGDGERDKKNILYYVKTNNYVKLLFVVFIITIIVSSFTKFDNVCDDNGTYLYGPPMIFLYLYGAFAVVCATFISIKNGKRNINFNGKMLFVGASTGAISMTIQLLYPQILVITAYLIFVSYCLYFAYENPDLFVISELNMAKYKSEKSNLAKSDFLTNMSHEIRTPISTILGLSEGIINLNNIEWDNIKEDVYHIYSSGENLLEVINNILDVSKIESGEDYVDNKEYSLGPIISDIKSVAQAKITSNDVSFAINVDKNIPSLLKGDKTKVYQILLNLVNNAIRFTNEGKIVVSISSELKDGRAHLFFKVLDTGIGISNEEQVKILDSFEDISSVEKSNGSKSGLGLVITNNLVRMLEGTFKFDSIYGAGSTFYADIYQDVIDMNPLGDSLVNMDSSKKIKKIDCSGYNVMLIDDNKLNLKVAERKFKDYNFNVVLVNSGLKGIDLIKKEEHFDLIVLDHVMNDIDGVEVLHVLKSMEEYDIPPIVMLTANALAGMKDLYITEGFDDYLSKPINDEELDRVINKFFKDSVQKREQDRANNIENIKNDAKDKDDIKMDTLGVKFLTESGIDYLSSLKFVGDIDTYNSSLLKFSNSIDDFIKQVNLARIKKDNMLYSKHIRSFADSSKTLGIKDLENDLKLHEEAGNKNDILFISDNFDDLILKIRKTNEIIKKYLKIKN